MRPLELIICPFYKASISFQYKGHYDCPLYSALLPIFMTNFQGVLYTEIVCYPRTNERHIFIPIQLKRNGR